LDFLSTLKQIENGELDQHNASVKAGKILKELYIDSTLKQQTKREKLEKR
jgi:hypothetical protein